MANTPACFPFERSAIVARACSWIFFSCHVMTWKHWHPRRKVKAKKNQSLQNHRVGLPSILHFFPSTFPLNLVFHFSQPHFHFVGALNNLFINFTAVDDGDDMFKPPSLDNDDFSPFGGKSGLFSGGRGLFDDDDEVRRAFFLTLPAASFYKPAANTSTLAVCCPSQGDLFSEEPKPPVAEERKVRNESLKSAGRVGREGTLQGIHQIRGMNRESLLSVQDSDRAGKKILAGAVSVLPGIWFRRALTFLPFLDLPPPTGSSPLSRQQPLRRAERL